MEYGHEGKDAKRARRMAGEPSDLHEMMKCAAEDEVGDYVSACARFVDDCAAAGRDLHEWHPSLEVTATRGEGVDIVFRVCEIFDVGSETICSSVVIFDRFLERATAMDPLHPSYSEVARLARDAPLLSVASFLITCKFREKVCPLLSDLDTLWDGRGSVDAIKKAELTILSTVGWNLRCVTALEVATKIMAGAPQTTRNHILQQVEFLVEISYYSRTMMHYPSSAIAVAAIRYAVERLNLPIDCSSFIPQYARSALDEEIVGVLEACFAEVHGSDDQTVPMATELDNGAQELLDRTASTASTQEDLNELKRSSMDSISDVDLECTECRDNGEELAQELAQELLLLSPTNVDFSNVKFQFTGGDVPGFACSGMPDL